MGLGVTFFQDLQTGGGFLCICLFSQFSTHEKPQALIAVAFPESQPRGYTVMGRNVQARMCGFHRIDFQWREAAQGGTQLAADIVVFHAGQVR